LRREKLLSGGDAWLFILFHRLIFNNRYEHTAIGEKNYFLHAPTLREKTSSPSKALPGKGISERDAEV
jgi:hypothetical protein